MKKKGSATIVIIRVAIVFILYASSTFSDVRHLRNTYDKYEKDLIEKYEQDYDIKVQSLGEE